MVDPATCIEEWTDGDSECKGLKTQDGKRRGIVRDVEGAVGYINFSQYNDDEEQHGLEI